MYTTAPYVIFMKGDPSTEPTGTGMTGEQLEAFVSYAHFPNDWLRFARMAFGGPPALMRMAMPPNGWTPNAPSWNHGDPKTDVLWFYVAKSDAFERGTTFSKLEEQYGELRKLLGETA